LIVVDNCIISSLSKIGRIELLKHQKETITSPGVVEEIINSEIESIIKSLRLALDDFLKTSYAYKPQEIISYQEDHPALSYVDCELILLSKNLDCPLLTDDTKLISIAEEEFDIIVFDLCDLLLALKEKNIISSEEIQKIIRDLEWRDHYKFSRTDLDRLK